MPRLNYFDFIELFIFYKGKNGVCIKTVRCRGAMGG
jgi:hypothetical protein